ncbi:class I SAM-dependent methyltransferase [Gordonia humi]|uniref:class I SAM-dependent methyltransferase n=1 Tax=Gordonia humi TaxID=686429 RepID=UPI00361A5506
MADERVSGPGTTAVFTAKMRALETDRPQPLIVDPLAQSFVDASGLDYGMVSVSAMTGQRLFESNVIRTWWLDREVRAAIAAGCVQVVILGSGLDSRAFRLATPGTKFFEVESSALAAFKRDAIAATGRSPVGEWSQVEVGIDDEWPAALAAGGYDATVPTCWVAEGMFYLTDDEASRVLTAARSMSAPGSRFLAAHFGQGLVGRSSDARDVDGGAGALRSGVRFGGSRSILVGAESRVGDRLGPHHRGRRSGARQKGRVLDCGEAWHGVHVVDQHALLVSASSTWRL